MAMQVKFPFGKLVSVLVTHVDDTSGNFFVQINDEAGKLDALMAEIEQNVLSGRAKPPTASEIMVGCIYVVQYQEDSRWYRARVLGVNTTQQQCEVFFVDYGNTELVPLSCVRNAEDRFCELPPQSFECELEGFERLRGDGFDEALVLLNETILEQELYCKAVKLKKNFVLVTQLFTDDKGTRSVIDEMQSGGAGTTTDALSNGHATIPRQTNLKRDVKYELISLPPDSFHDLSVTWVEDPSHFWCQLLSNAEILEELMENLAEVYTNLEPAVLPLQSCTVGYPCCAKFYEDDAWYRGIITNVSSIATGQIEVRFVDYGNTQNTELSDVKDLKEEFLKHPCQAMYFAIAGVDPASKDGLWADEAKALFEKLIKFKHVVGLVTSVESDGRHRVKLMDTTSDLDMELNQILIAANYGVKSADIPKPVATTVPAVGFKSSESAPNPAPPPVFVKENVPVGKEEKVLVTNIISPGKFYCQLFRNGPELENLMMEVGRHYSKLGPNEDLLSSPSPGDPCCAQFSEDGCWYRAVVLNTTPKGVTVLYIDYGNSETIPVGKIKKLIPKFSDLPQQGIECTLNRIKPKFAGGEPQWRLRDTDKFKDLALEMEGTMTVVAQDSNGVCRVELVVRNRREEQNISEQLLIGGNAELADGALPASANFNNLKSQTFLEPDLEVGQFEDVIVSYTEHPCNFWCQLQKSATQLDLLMLEIADLYSTDDQRSGISNPACGMLCCAQFTEDNKWYRGKISGVKKGGMVEVHFVDYGNYELLPLSRVKKLQAEHLSLPPQAVKCALAKIDPLDQNLLSDDVMNRFEELTLDKELVMMADKYDKSNGTFEVVLLDTSEGKNLDIAKDIQSILGPSTNRQAARIAGIEIQPGTSERVFVSSATSPAKFSCQLMKMADSLDELMNEMFEYYEQLSVQQDQLSKPAVGEFCAAKFTLDDGWYRAKVVGVEGNNVSVLYIDYGNSETLALSRLKALNSKFHSLPCQAIDCSLSGNCSGVSDTQFQELVSEKEFTARVVTVRRGTAVVDLVSKETNKSIVNTLSKETSQGATTSACNVANLQWKTGDTIDVFVAFAESAQKFFCQASAHSSELDDLMNRLEEHYSSEAENVSTIEVGSCCVAWYGEGGWYRAKVQQIQGREVKVSYIDYGDTATVPLSSIRTLKPEFSSLPAQGVQCCLKGFSAKQGPENFKDLVLEQEFKAQVIGVRSGGICEVDLVMQDGSGTISQMLPKDQETTPAQSFCVPSIQWKQGDNVDIFIPFVESAQKFFCQASKNASDLDELMGKLEEHYSTSQENVASITAGNFCIAKYEDGGWYRGQVTQLQGESVEVFYIDYGNTATLPLSSIRTLKPEFSTLPAQAVKCCLKGYAGSKGPEEFHDLVIEQEFDAEVVGVKAQNTFEVELVPKDGSTPISKALSKGTEIADIQPCSVASIQWKPGDKVNVFVPFVESAQKFFCQPAQTSSDLDDLMTRLEEHYRADQEAVTSISSGSFCVVQYEDGGWYRGQVTQVQGQSIEVFYIDYGNTAALPLSSIRTLKPEFSTLPAQAVKCCLKGYVSSTGPEEFHDLVNEQEFDAQVVAVKAQNTCEVELVPKDGSTPICKALSKGTETTAASPCSVASIQWKPGDKVDVFVPFVESEQKFFCQPAQTSSYLDDLMTKLDEHYIFADQEGVTSITSGSFCVAQYDDGGWYRVQATQVQRDSIEVLYIDYGNTAAVPLSNIRILKPEFSTLPAQAVKCCLKGYAGSKGPEEFHDLVIEQEFVAQVVALTAENTYEVELVSKDGSTSVSKTLSKGTETTDIQPCSVASIQWKCGDKVDVFVPFVESAQKFFCQPGQTSSDLDDIMAQLGEHYSADQEAVTSISVGSFCIAQYEDGGWYRAQATQVQGQSVSIFYIDYGDAVTLPLSSIRTLKPEFATLPAQAVQCSLKGRGPENFKDLVLEQEFSLQVIANKQPGMYEVELLSKDGSSFFGDALPCETERGLAPLAEFTEGSVIEVCPTTCVSPHLFYCQIATADHKGKLGQLMDQLQDHYEGLGEQEQGITGPTVGLNCAVVFADDGLWYRGRITKVVDQQLVEVFYIDFGNCDTVPLSKLKAINADLLQLPAQAIQCRIPTISPVSGVAWPDATVERFNNLVMHKKLLGKIIRKGSDESLEIELFDTTDSSVDINIGELLVKEGLASLGTSSPAKPAPAIKSMPALAKPKLAENAKVYVTAVESPGSFYCQNSSSEEKIASLMSNISAVYDSMPADELAVTSIAVGDVCCAQFSEDNQWYRAVVEENTASALTVRFIDYGNTETLPIDRTKVLADAFFGEPPLAIKCSLHDVQPLTGESWPHEAATLFEELTTDKVLDAKFVTFTDPSHIKLSDNSKDIGEELVKAQLAVAKTTSPGDSASGMIDYVKPVVECGEMYDVCITNMSSPGKFYCQLVNMRDQLEGMMNDLNDRYFQLSETEGCLVSPTVGQPCVALYEEMWYRAKVVNLSVNDVTVHYVDYGNDETLKPSAVKQITPPFLKIPQVAVECSLDLNHDEWSEETTTLFEELTGENKLIIKIVSLQGDRFEVKVFDKDANCISGQVLSTITGAVEESQQEKPALQKMAFHPGQTEDVYVVHIVHSQDFYVQLSKTYQQLVQMMAEISKVYSCLADDVRPEDLVVGAPLCAFYAEDEQWYRAVVESVPSEVEVGIRYIDYGNTDVVLLSDVRQLSKRFFDLPVQAIHCRLHSPEMFDSFQQRVDGKELKATFQLLRNDTWKVSLSDEPVVDPETVAAAMIPDTNEVLKINEFIQPTVTQEMRERVYVSHVVSPEEFYVQFESALDDLSLLSAEITQYYSQMQLSGQVLNNPCIGMSCCARFSQDGDWYRGRIKGVVSNGAKVEFVDYGNEEIVPFRDIKDPEKTFMQLPQQTILCCLDVTKDFWSAQQRDIFRTAALDKSFEAKFIVLDGEKWRVSLESNGVSVVDMFMAKESKVTSVQKESKVTSVQTGSYAQQQLFSGQIEEVFVSHVTESGDFYVQLSKTSPDLGTLEILVSETYDQLGPTQETMDLCFVDCLCCAKYSQDFKWYRALVTKVLSDSEVEVLFVDYGNTDYLRAETVKQLKPELLEFQVQAVKCRLEGSKENWTASNVEQFEASVMDKPLHVTFTRQEGDTWFVTIQELDMFTTKTTPKVKSFTEEVFDCNKRENAYFVYADSPDCIWLQPERSGDALLELMDQIAIDVRGQSMDKSQVMPKVPCLGQFTDNDAWHRAQILDVQGGTNVTVFYVDYGNSETLTLDRLHPISDAHLKLPAQAIHCHLVGVQGVEPGKVTSYLNEVLLERVLEVEVQDQHPDGSYTVKLFDAGAELSINDQLVGECLGDTSLVEEASLEQATPPRVGPAREKRAFKFPELESGNKVVVSFISAFLPSEMQLLLTERIEERDQLSNSMASLHDALDDSELKLENPEVGVVCCVHFSPEQEDTKKWIRGEVISISADETATVKLVDYGTHEKIPISELKFLKDELLQMPVFVLESSLANISPSSADGQWSPECSSVLQSLCRSKELIAEITQLSGGLVEVILTDESGKSINQSLVELGYAKAFDVQEDFTYEQLSLKWPDLQVGQCVEVYLMAVKDLQSIQLQLADSEADLTKMREQLTTVYSALGGAEEVVGNPRVGQACCAQFADDEEWYRAVVTCVSDAGVEVKFVDYGNMDMALSIKQLKEDFYALPVQCFKCSLRNVVPASDKSETEVAGTLLELCDGKALTAEVTSVSGDSVVVNLFDETGETKESVADILIKLGHAVYQRTPQEEPRRVSVSEDGKIVYKYPECGDVHSISLISVNSPSDFWCQLNDSRAELTSLSEKIELFYQSLGENDLRLLCLQVGDICCAKFTDDDKWYRSEVNQVCSDGQVCVRAVDYSMQETLTLNRIKKLEAEFAILPVQIINCSLGDVEPPHKYYGEEWSIDAVRRFKELCEEKELKIMAKGTDGGLTLVELIDSTGSSVGDQLLSEQLAVETKSPLMVTPMKDAQKQVSSEQVEKVLEQSSEDDVFQEAESGIEGVEEVAKEKGSEDEEEEFHDGSDQISNEPSSEEKKEILTNTESEQEGALEGEEVQVVEKKQVQDDKQKEEAGDSGLEQITEEVPEEKPSLEEQPEGGDIKEEEETEEEVESGVVHEEEKEEKEAQSSEGLDVSEGVECKLEEAGDVDSAETLGGAEKLEEEGDQEQKMEEGEVTFAVSEEKGDETQIETNIADSSETQEEPTTEDHSIAAELSEEKVARGGKEANIAAALSTEKGDGEEKEIDGVDGSETAGEELKETKTEEDQVAAVIPEMKDDGVEKEMKNNIDSSEIVLKEQEEPVTETVPVAAAVFEEKDDRAEVETSGADSSETAGEEQEEAKTEEGLVIATISEEKDDRAEIETSGEDSSETAGEGQAESKMEENPFTAGVTEQKDEGAEIEARNAYSSETAGEGQEGSKMEENPFTAGVTEQKDEGAEIEARNAYSSETAGEGHVGSKMEENPFTAGVTEQKDEGAEIEASNAYSSETAGEGQEGSKMEENPFTAGVTEQKDEGAEIEAFNADNSETAGEGQEELKVGEIPESAGVEEGAEEGAEAEEEDNFVEAQGDVTEAFSEEDLTAITGSADDEAAAAGGEGQSDGEWLQQSSSEETNRHPSAEEESAKVFLEEILTQVCRDADNPPSEQKENFDKTEDITIQTIATEEKPAKPSNSDTVECEDVDDGVLSDEALDQLDRELEEVTSDEKQHGATSTGAVLNGTGEQETHEVVENGQDGLEESDADISGCQGGMLTKASGTTEVGNDLATIGSDLAVE